MRSHFLGCIELSFKEDQMRKKKLNFAGLINDK